jgi:hypothetical protein
MKRDNGAHLALGALAALAVVSEVVRRRGSGNDPVQAQIVGDDDVTLMEIPRQDLGRMQSRYAAQARAEAQLPDARLGELLFSGGDVLAGMSFREAVNADPRRVEALITQRVNRAFAPAMGPPNPMAPQMYAEVMADLRRVSGGRLTVSAITGLVERTLDDSMFRVLPMLPPPVREAIKRQLPAFEVAFGEAAEIAREAAFAATSSSDRMDWTSFADYLRGHPAQMRIALTGALPGPAARRALPPAR